MKRLAFGLLLGTALTLGCCLALAAPPAGAQTGADLEIRIDKDERPRTLGITELQYHASVTLVDRATGQVPKRIYDVFAQAANPQGKEQSPVAGCEYRRNGDAAAPPGVYDCPSYVNHGGAWVLMVFVNQAQANPRAAPLTVARASAPFQIDSAEVYTGDPNKKVVTGRFTEVFALSAHGASGAVWFLSASALACLVLPALRRSLSARALYRIERRLDLFVKMTWSATALVIGSGTYLLLEQTAYKTPFSTSALDGVFSLPFGKPYFLALGFKLALYGVMVLASIPLVTAAQRQLRLPAAADSPDPWGTAKASPSAAEGTVLAPARGVPAVEAERPVSPLVRGATMLVIFGIPVILFCVTLLKYFHELVEASRNLPTG